LAKRLGYHAAILADAAKQGFGLGIFVLPYLQKKCKKLHGQRWTVFNFELNKTNMFRILPKNKWRSINSK
jgi:hypothetical protein